MTAFKLFFTNLIHFVFAFYTIMIFMTLLSSWVPGLNNHRLMGWVRKLTDPYLMIFRKIIPPIKGVLDISPILALFTLRFLEPLVANLVGWVF
jgi:YggT family protein